MNNKFVIFLSLVFFLTSCIDYDYRISDLPCKKLTFNELPVKLQERLSAYPSDTALYKTGIMLLEYKDCIRFYDEVKKIGPWIAYVKIIDANRNITYRIERICPPPYIIFNDRLYIPDEYNVLPLHNKKIFFSEYELK